MKKIFLTIFCLLIVSMSVACVAASDNSTINQDVAEKIDMPPIPVKNEIRNESAIRPENDTEIIIDNNTTADNDTIIIIDNNTTSKNDTVIIIDNNTTAEYDNITHPDNVSNAKPKAGIQKHDIKGRKNNNATYTYHGPIFPPLGSTQFLEDAYLYAKILRENPYLTVQKMVVNIFKKTYGDNYMNAKSIICRVHNLVLEKCHGLEKINEMLNNLISHLDLIG